MDVCPMYEFHGALDREGLTKIWSCLFGMFTPEFDLREFHQINPRRRPKQIRIEFGIMFVSAKRCMCPHSCCARVVFPGTILNVNRLQSFIHHLVACNVREKICSFSCWLCCERGEALVCFSMCASSLVQTSFLLGLRKRGRLK